MKNLQFLVVVLLIQLLSAHNFTYAHGCGKDSPYSYDWTGHVNWFLAPDQIGESKGLLINMKTMKVDTISAPENDINAFEGTSIVSDHHEKVLFYTNGRKVFTGKGNNVEIKYEGLLAGNEGGNKPYSSASQGVMIVRHPLNSEDFHVFTTNDAYSPGLGVHHFVMDRQGNRISGPNRLGTYTSSEAIAATMHANGSDIWIAVTDISGLYHTYLVTCNGLDESQSNLGQAVGSILSGDQLVGAMAFSWDRNKLAVGHPHSSPHQKKQIILYDFDNQTGAITSALDIGSSTNTVNAYDLVFSPNSQRLFISAADNQIYVMDLSSGDEETMSQSFTNTGITNSKGAPMEIGSSGKLYLAGTTSEKSVLIEVDGHLDTGTVFTSSVVSGTENFSSNGLPNMYIPPEDFPVIQVVLPICYNAEEVDLSTRWFCASTDAEEIPHRYEGQGIVDTEQGIFDPGIAGIGIHKINFFDNNCSSNSDKIYITVKNDQSCSITSSQELINPRTKIYPNPAKDVIYIGQHNSATIYSTAGQQLIHATSNEVDVSTLKPGVYHVILGHQNGIQSTHKLVVHH